LRFPYASFAEKEAQLVGDRSLSFSRALTVEAFLDVWALGDLAVIPTNRADYYPPTAQRASREGKVMAYNIVASVRSEALKPFQRKALDQLASIGRRQNSRHQLLRVYRVVALTNDLFAKITTASESPLDSLKKNRMDTLQFLIVSDDSRSCKDL
jgi:NADH dehydrogenase FAD-containing subunit